MELKHWLKKLYWNIDPRYGEIIHFREGRPFEKAIPRFSDEQVNRKLLDDNRRWVHKEFITKETNVTVEPECGYALRDFNTIIGATMREGRFLIPSPQKTLKARLTGRIKKIDKAILFDGSLGTNYFYFYSVLLHKLYLLEKHLDINGIPILVGSKTFQQRYFREMIQHPRLAHLSWLEFKETLKVQELIISTPMPYNPLYWERTRSLFIESEANITKTQALFIDRSNRKISNFHKIEPILEKYNIEIIDPADLSVSNQAKIFNSASHLIGIHGAGMTNFIVFSTR